MTLSSDAAVQVRLYRPKWWLRIFSIFFFAFSTAGLIHFTRGILAGEEAPNWVSIVGPAFLSLVGLGMVAHHFNTFVIIFADAIELETLWSRKRLSVSEIRGRREYESTDSDGVTTRYIKLLPVDRKKQAIEFSRFYNFDGAFEQWLRQFPKVQR
jgi:hypothetical protein